MPVDGAYLSTMDSFDTDPAVTRLRALANQPIDAAVARDHFQAMASAPVAAPVRSRFRMAMAGSLMAGALVGGAGIAAAFTGSLPDRAQAIAHNALGIVGVPDAPRHDTAGKSGEDHGKSGEDHGTPRFTRGCTNPDGSAFTGNHGAYVKAHPDDPRTADVNEREQAAQSDCGKPLVSVTSTTAGTGEDHGQSGDDHGKSGDHKPAVTGAGAAATHETQSEQEHGTTTTTSDHGPGHSGSEPSGERSSHRG